MEEFSVIQSMFNILNSNNPNKKFVIEALPIMLNTYDEHGSFNVYNLIITSTQNLCFQMFNIQCEKDVWNDSNVDNLLSLLIYFIDIIGKHSKTDIVQLFRQYVELTNKIDFKNCPNKKLKNIEICLRKLYILTNGSDIDDCVGVNNLRSTLVTVLNQSYLNKHKSDTIMMLLNNISSVSCVPVLWQNIKPMIKTHSERTINLLFNMQCLFFDSLGVGVLLNDNDFWSLLCELLNHENNVIRTYNHVVLKLACSHLSNVNADCRLSENNEKLLHVWNDYVVVMETLENTQQHLVLPILGTAKGLAPRKVDTECGDFKLPIKWITAMCCKMSKHSSRYVVLASMDIIVDISTKLLRVNKQILQSFVDSLNNVFLYKMTNEVCVDRPRIETVLLLWFDELMTSDDGHEVFDIFLSYMSCVKWTVVPLLFLTKSLASISSNPPLKFNMIDRVMNVKLMIQEIPNSYLKSIVLSFLFEFTSKFFGNVDTEFHYDLFDCITVYRKDTDSWNYIVDLVRKTNDSDSFDRRLAQRVNKLQNNCKMRSTSLGLLVLSDISTDRTVCMEKLDEMYSNEVNTLDFVECLLEVESNHGQRDSLVSRLLDKHVWPLTVIWVEKNLQVLTDDNGFEDTIVCSFLDKVLSSSRTANPAKTMNIWLDKCNSVLMKRSGNFSVLAIYSWIGKYATSYSADDTLKNDWLLFTKHFIDSGFFTLKGQSFYHLKKPGMHTVPQLDIINTFFQHSTVSVEQILYVFDWLTGKTIERHDNYWSTYFSTTKTFLCKFPMETTHLKKVIRFVQNCWEFLIDCRVSCFLNSIKIFIEMVFSHSLLTDENYIEFVESQIIQNLLTEKYRDKFNAIFSLFLLKYFQHDQSNVFKILETRPTMSKFFAKCLLFSIDRYGTLKIEWDTFEYVRLLNDFPLINDISTECLPDDRFLRFSAMKYLYKLNSTLLWKNVLNAIIQIEMSLRDRKFFHNSKAYRVKQRAVQILLFVACHKPHKSLIFNENIYKWSLSSLKEVSHIHSVAYQLIWLLVLMYNNKCPDFSAFWNDFNNAEENINYLCSFISILYHLQKTTNNDQLEVEAKKRLLYLCFSNGYKIRLYAQVTICRLYSGKSAVPEWSLLCETIESLTTKYEEIKKYENPFNDFFYQELDTINSLFLKNICIEVPRLLNIVYEERFPAKWFDDFSITMTYNDKYDLSRCSVSSFIEKNTSLALSNDIVIVENSQNAQRKYFPSQPKDECTNNSSLIVVASLIDKVTNLGGLARTCQVFGVSTLIVNSLSCLEKREFTALSMTAEKHQPIIEVRVKNLKSYLQKKKNEGYQIVAAEQTVNSVELHKSQLPFKCVLLLGNETSGISHDLLSVMDVCVEIQQTGIVRSLNVHVAGSLFIWEYVKQHCLNASS